MRYINSFTFIYLLTYSHRDEWERRRRRAAAEETSKDRQKTSTDVGRTVSHGQRAWRSLGVVVNRRRRQLFSRRLAVSDLLFQSTVITVRVVVCVCVCLYVCLCGSVDLLLLNYKKTVLDRGSRSDRPRWRWPLTLTDDLDFQIQASYGCDSHTESSKVSRFKR